MSTDAFQLRTFEYLPLVYSQKGFEGILEKRGLFQNAVSLPDLTVLSKLELKSSVRACRSLSMKSGSFLTPCQNSHNLWKLIWGGRGREWRESEGIL